MAQTICSVTCLNTGLWQGEQISELWINTNIILKYNNNGGKKDYNNSRVIFLLLTVGKVLARTMLNRLVRHISEPIIPESQCESRKERGARDMIFTLKTDS